VIIAIKIIAGVVIGLIVAVIIVACFFTDYSK
jgi:hypothetical protein